jgi:Spy/CpxP family protein refolding chaperone
MHISKTAVAVIFATALALPVAPALAGPGMHGPGGWVGLLNAQLHQQLNLTPDLETQWQKLVAEKASLHKQNQGNHQQLRATLDTELAKPTPDLGAINSALNTAQDAAVAGDKQFRQDALSFYAALTPDRQAILITALKEHLAQAKAHRWMR